MVSVICPIYNEEKYIDQCINSILHQDYPHDDLEVLFVDGMSLDKTRNIVLQYSNKYPFIKLLDNEQRIVPSAMNIGIRKAKGDIIIRLDAHAIYPSNYFSELVIYLNKLDADNVGGICRTLPCKETNISLAISIALSSGFGMGNSYFRIGIDKIRPVDTVPFGCFKKELFDRIGYFDEDLIRNQDDEFNGRIIKNGGKIYLLPHLIIDYFARDSILKTTKMFYQYGLFKPLVNSKLGSPATLRQFIPLLFVAGLVVGALLSLINSAIALFYFVIIVFYFVLAVLFALKDGKKILLIPILIWVYFLIHVSYGVGYWTGLYKLIVRKSFVANINR